MRALQFVDAESNFYVLKGKDPYLLDHAEAVLIKSLHEKPNELNFVKLTENFSAADIAAFADTYSLFGGRRLLIARDFAKKPNKAEEKELLELAARLSPDTLIALTDTKDQLRFLAKTAVTIDCGAPETEDVRKFIFSQCAQAGLDIDLAAVSLLQEYTRNNLGKINLSLQKLVFLCENKRITAAHIKEGVSEEPEFSVFMFAGALADREHDRALEILSSMLASGSAPTFLLSVLASQYRRMLMVSVSKESADILSGWLGIKPKAVDYSRRSAKKYTVKELKRIVDMLEAYELRMKSGGGTPEQLLYEAVANIMAGIK